MKRVLTLLLVLTMVLGILSGCTNNVPAAGDKPVDETIAALPEGVTMEEKDGLTVYTDLKNSPFENSGLKITIKKGENGYIKFVKVDLEGRETVDYYTFDYSKNILEKYYYVSAMGSAYYYYYDLNKSEVYKVEDQEHKDITQTMKDSDRLGKAQEKIAGEIASLEDYYKKQYNMTIKEAVSQK